MNRESGARAHGHVEAAGAHEPPLYLPPAPRAVPSLDKAHESGLDSLACAR